MQPVELQIVIQWHKFEPGTSLFIPCLNRPAMQKFIQREAARLKMSLMYKRVIEKGIYGLRVWKIADTI